MALSDFIKLYDSTWDLLMQEQDGFPLEEYSNRTIWTTWKMSYEQISHRSQEAAGLLRLWAFLDRGDLWYELAASASKLRSELDIEAPDWLPQVVGNQLAFSSALRILTRYSLIDAIEETSSHSMHAVLHKWCYSLPLGSEKTELSEIAISIVALSVPSESNDDYRVLQRRLLPHAMQVFQWALYNRWIFSKQMSDNIQGWLFQSLGAFLADQDKLAEAEKIYQPALESMEKALGPKHISTLNIVNNIGNLYKDQGKLAKAEEMYQRALKGYEETLGPEHISTLLTVNNLGVLYKNQGKLTKAEEMCQLVYRGPVF
jgi:tetratricopeptide (TPR) repeat protein